MSLFDTDHITALDRGGEEGERLRARLAHVRQRKSRCAW